ncbi:retrovirus-related Pol polyprotein from transposon 297 [Trichonephila clavipes]|nr:retrovirus-related Pol polyprotein from transposon 297 [Trichonephila clavipes]
MANLLRNCEDFAVPYLDDIAIFSLAWDDHLKHLKDVFDRLRSAKLHIKPSKCQFAQAYVKYLGHLVGQGLRTPGELKVQVIKDFPIPTNKTQGRNRKSTVDWNSSCQNAFEELKTRLSKNPVLYSPDFTKPFIIQCDASNLGIGVVLSQVCENEEHPIMFLSKKLSLAEQKYSTTEKECAAIIFAVQKLKCYLDGHQKFVIQTDHNPLVWRRFVEWAQNEIAVVPDFHKRILFSDEAHFWSNDNVNKQNCRIWSEANPQVYVETPLHPEKLTVWCALWAGGILLQKTMKATTLQSMVIGIEP